MENRVYPYRHVVGPPVAALREERRGMVKVHTIPLECGHTVDRQVGAPVPAKTRCEHCPPTTMIGV